jgi:class 3 adenylate cyclase
VSSDSAWLELPSGATVPIEGTCAIGRAASNQLRLDDDHVSRHHAVIRTTEADGCWIFDLGSANGTYVDQRRINSRRLGNGDTIGIGPYLLVLHSAGASGRPAGVDLRDTVPEVRSVPAWLLVIDIERSTDISRRLGPLEMERVYGEWLARCKTIVQDTGGIVDKLLGDGLLAFWPAGERAAGEVAQALLAFKRFRFGTALPFRMVLHRGTAFSGGEIASGMYRLFGVDVNFAFRMETLAKALGEQCLLSETARQALGLHIETKPAGSHALPGLEGSYPMFRV